MLSAVHAFLARLPASWSGFSWMTWLETVPVNLPGVGPDRFACWRRHVDVPGAVIRCTKRRRLVARYVPGSARRRNVRPRE